MAKYPTCKRPFGAKCFAYSETACTILRDTDFGHKLCPFYKTKKQFNEDKEKYDARYR